MTVADEAACVLERTIELCAVPAPPLDETGRCRVVAHWWQQDGLEKIATDQIGNLWAQVRSGVGPAILVAAHLDTVFDRSVAHGARPDGHGRLIGPSVGDDSVAVASLSSLFRLLPAQLGPPVWVVATVGEEGLGNLAGVTEALAAPPVPIAALIALEGNYLGRVNIVGLGSVRSRVTVSAPGGHAWEDSLAPSAVHIAAEMVHELDSMPRPAQGKTSVNVGTITGGESINARGQHCTFEVDLRAEDAATLSELAASTQRVFETVTSPVEVHVESIGNRPAGQISETHPLVQAAARSLELHGVTPRFTSASTDANAAYHVGMPAITVGITYGDKTHTEEEWIDIDPIGTGLETLVTTICSYVTQEDHSNA